MFERITVSYKPTSLTGEPVTSVRRRRTWDLDSPGTRLCRSNCHNNSICNKRKVSWNSLFFDIVVFLKQVLQRWVKDY